VFVVVLAANSFVAVLGNWWYGPSGVWKPVFQHTYGLVNQTLLWGVAASLVVVGGVLLGIARQRPTVLGIDLRNLPAAGLYTAVVWFAVQFLLAGCYVALGKSLAFANGWNDIAVLGKLGGLVGQLLGNALYEEIVFRGFFLMQFFWLFRTSWAHQPMKAFVFALLCATVLFTLPHVAAQLRPDNYRSVARLAWDQAQVFAFGCIFGWIYWQTRNLFFVVGVHALANEPTTLFAWHDLGALTRTDPVVLLIAVAFAAVWHRLPATRLKPAC